HDALPVRHRDSRSSVDCPGFASLPAQGTEVSSMGPRCFGAHLRGHEVSAVGAFPSAPAAGDRPSPPRDATLGVLQESLSGVAAVLLGIDAGRGAAWQRLALFWRLPGESGYAVTLAISGRTQWTVPTPPPSFLAVEPMPFLPANARRMEVSTSAA